MKTYAALFTITILWNMFTWEKIVLIILGWEKREGSNALCMTHEDAMPLDLRNLDQLDVNCWEF